VNNLRVNGAIDGFLQFFIVDTRQKAVCLGQSQLLPQKRDKLRGLAQIMEYRQDNIGGRGLSTVFLGVFLFDIVNVFTFFHLLGKVLLVIGGQQMHPPDFVEVDTHRVIGNILLNHIIVVYFYIQVQRTFALFGIRVIFFGP